MPSGVVETNKWCQICENMKAGRFLIVLYGKIHIQLQLQGMYKRVSPEKKVSRLRFGGSLWDRQADEAR